MVVKEHTMAKFGVSVKIKLEDGCPKSKVVAQCQPNNDDKKESILAFYKKKKKKKESIYPFFLVNI